MILIGLHGDNYPEGGFCFLFVSKCGSLKLECSGKTNLIREEAMYARVVLGTMQLDKNDETVEIYKKAVGILS